MVQSLGNDQVQSLGNDQDFYTSKITNDLRVMDTDDMEAFEKVRAEPGVTLIGTRADHFHCDEALSMVMLLYTDKYKNSVIIRTIQEDVFDKLDVLTDVGSLYDHERLRYGHHFSTFSDTWNNKETDVTQLSAAGLIYRHFGKEVITNAVR